ncbi:MAG: MBL fold metallo-hydrolase [Ignavibacteria bacterium]|nr:MBL fold metallo-hydrolase [Ignavibacteria bacterium]
MRKSVSRRSFLGTLSAAAGLGLAQDDSGRIRRWLESIYRQDDPAPPPLIPDPATWDDNELSACWIGHSTVLLNLFGTTILTDPVFGERVGLNVGGLFTLGPKRLVAPALTVRDLPPIDIILISHGHMDHSDLPSLDLLPKECTMIVPKGTGAIFDGLWFRGMREISWGETLEAGQVVVEAIPVIHRGSRYPWAPESNAGESDPGLSNGYLLTTDGISIVYGGDTAYYEGYKSLQERGMTIPLAILPIGGYIPHHDNHCTPEEALIMADAMGARQILPVHWGTFPGEEGLKEPVERLRAALGDRVDRIAVDVIGGTWHGSQSPG